MQNFIYYEGRAIIFSIICMIARDIEIINMLIYLWGFQYTFEGLYEKHMGDKVWKGEGEFSFQIESNYNYK